MYSPSTQSHFAHARHLWDSSPRGETPSAQQADALAARPKCLLPRVATAGPICSAKRDNFWGNVSCPPADSAAFMFLTGGRVCPRSLACRGAGGFLPSRAMRLTAGAAVVGCSTGYMGTTGCLVQWHDSRFGCERSWVQFPKQPFCLSGSMAPHEPRAG